MPGHPATTLIHPICLPSTKRTNPPAGHAPLQSRRPLLWAVILLAVIAHLRFAPDAGAASPEPGDATYHALRYNDDFSYRADPARSTDPWDPLKYIPVTAMFPRLPYFAETSMLVPSNLYDIRPVLSFKPTPNLFATLGWDTLWRASRCDGLYGSGLV